MARSFTRREAIQGLAVGGAAMAASQIILPNANAQDSEETGANAPLKGNINHSVCRWCYNSVPLDELCVAAKAMGILSIELQGPDEWPLLKEHGLTCAIGNGAGMGIQRGFNRPEYHDALVEDYEKLIPQAAEADIPSVICFSGNREGMDDETGLANCAVGLKRLMPICEEHGVNLTMELLNSFGHKDYMCDHTAWGVALAEEVGSERFGLLYDVFHMQIMEGNIIDTIKKSAPHIHHYHTGGVPGRAEIDDTQEIYYPAVMRAIVETGYTGFVGHEFIPRKEDKLESLRQGVLICDV